MCTMVRLEGIQGGMETEDNQLLFMNLIVFRVKIEGTEPGVLITNQLTIKIKNRTFAGLKKSRPVISVFNWGTRKGRLVKVYRQDQPGITFF